LLAEGGEACIGPRFYEAVTLGAVKRKLIGDNLSDIDSRAHKPCPIVALTQGPYPRIMPALRPVKPSFP